MKNTLIVLAAVLVLAACKQESTDSTQDQNQTTETSSEKESDAQSHFKVFKSTDTGTAEFLKLVEENGKREWYYWSEKNEKEVRLGVKTIDGLEAVYFFGKPGELYEIGGSECGFSLFLGEKRLQWYDQIEPECTESYSY